MIIYKYQLNELGITEITVNGPYRVLKIALQKGFPVAWIEIDRKNEPKNIKLYGIPTGVPFDNKIELEYLDSTITDDFVVHYYKEKL